MAFHFQHTKLDYADGERWSVGDWSLPELKRIIGRWQDGLAADGWNTLYWENHDQPRSVSRYGDPENYRRESATLLGTFILTLRGTPYIYQGQELGMTNADWETMDDLRDVDAINHARELLDQDGVAEYDDVKDIVGYRTRDNARTPMQWDDSKNAGFTDGDPWIQVNPNYREINAADQQADVDSVYSYYQRLIQLRADRDVLVYGDYTDLLPDHETVFAFTRSLSANSETERVLVVLHFDDATETVDLPVEYVDATLLEGNYDRDDTDPETVTLAPYEARVYELFD
jgi:oligo-1,6-glucosidase/alpha-glucosidase